MPTQKMVLLLALVNKERECWEDGVVGECSHSCDAARVPLSKPGGQLVAVDRLCVVSTAATEDVDCVLDIATQLL